MSDCTDEIMQYIDFATDRQKQFISESINHGSIRKAAKFLEIDESTIRKSFYRLKAHAAKQGFAPECNLNTKIPEGFSLKGTSTLYDENSNVKLQWVKTNIDLEKQKLMMLEVLDSLKEELPKYEPIHIDKNFNNADANLYVITDYHLGMYSWEEETGDNWDINIAENTIISWFKKAIELAPNTQKGVFAQLGDFLHWDGLEAVTPTHKNILDADTRFQKVVRTAIRVIRNIINMLLEKHEEVYVIMADANHDPAGSVWLREWLAAVYDNEPRVIVDCSSDSYYCYELGNTSLFFHHGHKKKVNNIDDVFVAKFREVFGKTKYSYAHLGHYHHIQTKETNLMLVEQHRTLAAKDAYSSRGGYVSDREAKVITYSSNYGEIGRITIKPEMLFV